METPNPSDALAAQRAELRTLAGGLSAGSGLDLGTWLSLLILFEHAGIKLTPEMRASVLTELRQHRADVRALRLARIHDVNHGERVAG